MKFLPGSPAAVVDGFLVVAEVHLGIEYSMQEKGARVFPQPKKTAGEINLLLKKGGVKKIIFLGDLKHGVRGFEEREKRILREFVSELDAEKTILVKGNHDAGIESLEGLEIASPEGIVVREGRKKFGLAHGHAWPSKEVFAADSLLLGHTHPVVEFVDANGSRLVEKAWLVGETKFCDAKARAAAAERGVSEGTRVIVFPAFSKWASGIPVNSGFPTYSKMPDGRIESRKKRPGLLGPVLASGLFDLQNARAFTLDGVELGRVAELKPQKKLGRQEFY